MLEDSPIFEIINKKNLEKIIYKSNFELNDEKKFLFNFLNLNGRDMLNVYPFYFHINNYEALDNGL